MSTQSVGDRLVFATGTGESLLPPECALIVLTSTLATPATFLLHHFLQETIKAGTTTADDTGIIYLSFLNGFDQFASGAKKLVSLSLYACVNWQGGGLEFSQTARTICIYRWIFSIIFYGERGPAKYTYSRL
jgi:hypothetical protein